MHRNFAPILVATAALAAGLSQPAQAGAYGEALAAAMPRHAAQRDAFAEGARSPGADSALLPVVARGNLSVCRVRGFEASQDGMRKPDPYTDGARMGRFDVFTEGARAGSRNPYADGARSDARGSGECLS
ncbi:hypothetical protein [Cupriavidus taiwanensis]|uniref:hypothetical protein n=1 Tax=Cupriavidus taiwanensis TaxID=164546 RepID=UPI000E107FF3|nr:hypothetical protein [Cupriavidus taiwanensis]SOY42563.1 conserved hypothetical protein; putative exported protein [Cupriavidus taiwanensis]SOY58731.1 conserved hypothetical protein; putative exported protein [Cupriavidus taiwanensis]SOY80034.1 conserved hypothetical protein; putative exported protein [Cupriavidus taiwanensis]SOZ50613.1 conserved hypothetical protein; putative exported protein [Cupriavidus taiwanensis]SOZ75847.1 conserved hypothetical protein; putative exported protein [Cup